MSRLKKLANKLIVFPAIFIGIVFACSNEMEELEIEETSKKYDISPILSKFEGTGLSFEIREENVIFTTQDLPNHTSLYWPSDNDLYSEYDGSNPDYRKNPNTIATQNIVLTLPLYPSEASYHQATPLGAIGISRNGVVFYNQYAGPDQPLTTEINSFDQWAGHPQGTGQYHYHIEPIYLTRTFGKDAFLGLLADGFPVYGPVEGDHIVTNDDLDAFHGHFSETTDFPEGIYHYHINNEDPYLNGSGYFGTPGSITK